MLADGPRTVVNPERRSRNQTEPVMGAENSILRRLFPTDSELRSGAPRDAAGIRLDHFEIVERIGSGGMSAVFEARDTRLDRIVALKVLTPEHSRDGEAVQRFLNEARAAARLNHPNIVKSFHVGASDGIHFIAYEYVDGENLRDHVRHHGRPDVREAVNITIQIALALQHADSQGIVHRDIKPSNIVVNDKRQAKLIDLGLARQPVSPGDDELTIAGTTLGTFDYVSPEQARDPRNVDVRSDVYSLGCTLYHMLTGEPPYPEGTMLQKLLDHQAKQPPNPAKANPRVPPALASLCQRMMASNPRRRPPNAEALLHELAVIASQLGLQAAQPEGLVWGVPESRSTFWEKHLGWMTTVALLLVIVFALDRFPPSESTSRPAPPPEWSRSGEPLERGGGPKATPGTTAEKEPSEPAPGRETDTSIEGSESTGSAEEIARTPTEGGPGEEESASDGVETPIPNPGGSEPDPGEPVVETDTGPDFSIVAKDGGPLRGFSSLAGAVAAAADGDVVELAYDGAMDTRPIRVVGKSLTIRAANGFTPSIRFVHDSVPTEEAGVRMISVSDGAIDLVNLDVAFRVEEAVVLTSDRRWSLFALHGNERIEIRNTRITIDNPGRRSVAVVDVLEPDLRPAASGVKMMKPGGGETNRTELRFVNAVVRGEADVVVVERTHPVRLEFENTLLAVGQSAVHVTGSNRPPGESDTVDVRAAHTTALVGNGLVRFESGEFPRYLPTVEFSSRNNVFVTRTDVALVSAQGSTDLQDFRELLRWTGDTNFYDGFRHFWTTPPSQTLSTIRDVDFEGWKRLWNSTGMYGSVTWVTPPEAGAYSGYLPVDFTLDPEAPTNPAINGATDGTNAGADLTTLGPVRP